MIHVPSRARARLLAALLALPIALAPTPLDAQGIGARLKQKVKDKVEQRSDQALDRAVDAADQHVACIVSDSECIRKAQEEGRPVRYTDEDGNPVQPPEGTATTEASRMKPGEGAWANYDFVPGDRIIFAEDFTRDRVGNFPQRLDLKEGNAEVVEWNGSRWLRILQGGALRVPLPEILPERFTLEFDATIPWYGMHVFGHEHEPSHHPNDGDPHSIIALGCCEAGLYRGNSAGNSVVDTRRALPGAEEQLDEDLLTDPVRVRVMADGRYVKVYLNEVRVSNMPNADFVRSDGLVFHFADNSDGTEFRSPLLANIVVAASDRTLYDALMADGRVATQGILFDTGSDRIRPESTPTLAEIAAMLQEHPDLALIIEGHTDGQGQPAANTALSERRAAAVKGWLAEQGIDAGRLETVGFGPERPVADNTTPEGRQQNRRVELVRR